RERVDADQPRVVGEIGHGDVLFWDRCADEVEPPCSTAALHGQFDRLPETSAQRLRDAPDVPPGHGRSRHLGDHVAGPHARACRGGAGLDAGHEHAAAAVPAAVAVLGAQPQPDAAVVAVEAALDVVVLAGG